eukprot:m.286167 g.286167  ORF g.286167 m.286167 type:complete len:117 (+) comp19924_c1_seq6:316-666(+)
MKYHTFGEHTGASVLCFMPGKTPIPTHVVNGQAYCFRTVLVDPPRMGLDEATVRHVRRYRNILYISCSPDALQRNLKELSTTHKVACAVLFDHFPKTPHLETAVHLTARDTWQDPA